MSDTLTLVIFDIDGTLIDSTAAHHASLTQVLRDFGLDPHSKPWADYRHYTDSGVFDELWSDHRGRGATVAELIDLNRRTLEAYGRLVAGKPIPEIAGARALLSAIAQRPDMAAVFATGSMRGTAEVKLSGLDIVPSAVIAATGSDFLSRQEIVRYAVARWRAQSSGQAFNVVVLGDGRWDEVTARGLHIPFVGVQTGLHVFDPQQHLVVTDLMAISPDILIDIARPPGPALLTPPENSIGS